MHHLDVMRFVDTVTDENRWMSIDVVDFSSGGVGFISDVFFARALDLEIEILNYADSNQPVLLGCEMRVKRVQMTDRRPAYLIGCSFNDLDDETQHSIDALIGRMIGNAEVDLLGGRDHV